MQHNHNSKAKPLKIRSTTVLFVRKDHQSVMISDGQVTLGETVLKKHAKKVRKMYHDKIIAGFAGTSADAITLFELFEGNLNQYSGDLVRSSVELSKLWRTDKMLRRLEAIILVADAEKCFLISGNGDVIEPDEAVVGIGSGGAYAYAAALAMYQHSSLSGKEIAEEAMKIASSICIYTNHHFSMVEL